MYSEVKLTAFTVRLGIGPEIQATPRFGPEPSEQELP